MVDKKSFDIGGWIGPQPALPFPRTVTVDDLSESGCCIAFSLLLEQSGIRLPDV
jgi:hypothetical protein